MSRAGWPAQISNLSLLSGKGLAIDPHPHLCPHWPAVTLCLLTDRPGRTLEDTVQGSRHSGAADSLPSSWPSCGFVLSHPPPLEPARALAVPWAAAALSFHYSNYFCRRQLEPASTRRSFTEMKLSFSSLEPPCLLERRFRPRYLLLCSESCCRKRNPYRTGRIC